jgi:tetratricopeptide (TPR) repeat protein
MKPISLGLSPYVFRKGFSYRAYLEERSHFEDLSASIDESIARHVLPLHGIHGTLEQQSRVISEELAHIRGSLEGIADRIDNTNAVLHHISDQMSGLQDTLDDLLFSVQAGFRAMDSQLTSINVALRTLIEIAKTPAQTWAAEQLSIGENLLRRGLPQDALVHFNQALNGYGDHPGYRYWPLPHFLRGLILIGAEQGRQRVDPDLSAAAEAFQNAATYADDATSIQEQKMRLDALCAAGWCAYAEGHMDLAIERLSEARKAFPGSAKAAFLEAKVHFNQSREDDGLEAYGQAIHNDPRYIFLAARDADFQEFGNSVAKSSNQARQTLEGSVGRLADLVAPFVPDSPHSLGIKLTVPLTVSDLQVEGKPVSRLFKTRDHILSLVPKIESEINELEKQLSVERGRLDRALARRPATFKPTVDPETSFKGLVASVMFGIPLAFVLTIVYQYFLTQKYGGGFWGDFAVAVILCSGGFILVPIIKETMNSAASHRKAESLAASEELRALKQKPELEEKASRLQKAKAALSRVMAYTQDGGFSLAPGEDRSTGARTGM